MKNKPDSERERMIDAVLLDLANWVGYRYGRSTMESVNNIDLNEFDDLKACGRDPYSLIKFVLSIGYYGRYPRKDAWKRFRQEAYNCSLNRRGTGFPPNATELLRELVR